MPATDLPLLIEAAHAAGREASVFVGPLAVSWEKPENAGPVTEADIAVNELLISKLRAARPDYGWLSEETEDSAERLSKDTIFIVDPIDGTRSFVAGSRTWAISIAIAQQGRITAAVVFLPLRNKMYAAGLGIGTTLNGKNRKSCKKLFRVKTAKVLATSTKLRNPKLARWSSIARSSLPSIFSLSSVTRK